MSRASKFFLLAVGGLATLGVLVAAVAAVILPVKAKPWVETLTSEALEMEASTMTLLADEPRTDWNNDDQSNESRVRRGFVISPVRLVLRWRSTAH